MTEVFVIKPSSALRDITLSVGNKVSPCGYNSCYQKCHHNKRDVLKRMGVRFYLHYVCGYTVSAVLDEEGVEFVFITVVTW